jgi:hypothetical protein|tara:strand:+ start:125 stop:322 length:198 start_codon:yes stop_codon:yes gene_type:complete
MSTGNRKVYAFNRVTVLKSKLSFLHNNYSPMAEHQKAINSTKQALRRWLREFPDMDPEFLASITR